MSCDSKGRFVYQKQIKFELGMILDQNGKDTDRPRVKLYTIYVTPSDNTLPSMVTLHIQDFGGNNTPEFKPEENGLYLYKIDFEQTDCIDFAVKVLSEKLTEDKLPEGFIQKLM